MTDLDDLKLPDLSTWHPVPVGATIPSGTLHAICHPDGTIVIGPSVHQIVEQSAGHRFTAERIAVPLPTEDGASIIAYLIHDLRPALLTRRGDLWLTIRDISALFTNEDIDRWTPAPTEWHQR